MARTAAEEATLAATAGKFDQAADDLNGMLTNLMNQLSVLETAWQGRGGRSFTSVRDAYRANQEKLRSALAETASGIRSSGVNYAATDEAQAGQVGGINTDVNLNL